MFLHFPFYMETCQKQRSWLLKMLYKIWFIVIYLNFLCYYGNIHKIFQQNTELHFISHYNSQTLFTIFTFVEHHITENYTSWYSLWIASPLIFWGWRKYKLSNIWQSCRKKPCKFVFSKANFPKINMGT